MPVFCVRFSFFPYEDKRLAWGNVSRFRVEWDAKPQLSQSISEGINGWSVHNICMFSDEMAGGSGTRAH